jgi:hypothetical protein
MSKPGQITMDADMQDDQTATNWSVEVTDLPHAMFAGAVETPVELRPVAFRRWFESATIAKLRSTKSPGPHYRARRAISLLRLVLINNVCRSFDMVNVEPGPRLRDRNWSSNRLQQTDPQDIAMPFLPETKETTPGETTQNRAKPTRKSIERTKSDY